jgi:glutathione synthase/RimK-type ligase-like ATP-grasp enzyme
MRKIGIIYGMENSFPGAVVERINALRVPDVYAEHIHIGGIRMAEPSGYRVIIDRISHDIPFYRAYLKNAILGGTIVINNPFWWSADDKFFNYSLASQVGIAIPKTVLLPHHTHPPGTTSLSMRNLVYPLNWDEIFGYIGFPAFLKPHSGGGWKSVYKVHNPDEFFAAYNETGDLCMTLQTVLRGGPGEGPCDAVRSAPPACGALRPQCAAHRTRHVRAGGEGLPDHLPDSWLRPEHC